MGLHQQCRGCGWRMQDAPPGMRWGRHFVNARERASAELAWGAAVNFHSCGKWAATVQASGLVMMGEECQIFFFLIHYHPSKSSPDQTHIHRFGCTMPSESRPSLPARHAGLRPGRNQCLTHREHWAPSIPVGSLHPTASLHPCRSPLDPSPNHPSQRGAPGRCSLGRPPTFPRDESTFKCQTNFLNYLSGRFLSGALEDTGGTLHSPQCWHGVELREGAGSCQGARGLRSVRSGAVRESAQPLAVAPAGHLAPKRRREQRGNRRLINERTANHPFPLQF